MGLKPHKPKHNIYYNSISFFFFFSFFLPLLTCQRTCVLSTQINFFFHAQLSQHLLPSPLLVVHILLFQFLLSTIFFLLLLFFRASKFTKLLFSLSNTIFNVIFYIFVAEQFGQFIFLNILYHFFLSLTSISLPNFSFVFGEILIFHSLTML